MGRFHTNMRFKRYYHAASEMKDTSPQVRLKSTFSPKKLDLSVLSIWIGYQINWICKSIDFWYAIPMFNTFTGYQIKTPQPCALLCITDWQMLVCALLHGSRQKYRGVSRWLLLWQECIPDWNKWHSTELQQLSWSFYFLIGEGLYSDQVLRPDLWVKLYRLSPKSKLAIFF